MTPFDLICTLQMSATVHSAAHSDHPRTLQTALREVAEMLREISRKTVSTAPMKVAEILWKFAEMCGNAFGESSSSKFLCRKRAAVHTHTHTPQALRVRMVLDLSDTADLYLGPVSKRLCNGLAAKDHDATWNNTLRYPREHLSQQFGKKKNFPKINRHQSDLLIVYGCWHCSAEHMMC